MNRTLPVAAFVLLASPSWADTAIVVGVGTYPHLGPRTTLQGPKGDAATMEAALKRHGFDRVELLVEEAATRKAIVAALESAKASVKPTERFVFYFAGHGRSRPKYGVLPYDAKPYDNWISAEELHALVKAVPAQSRTVILDSCFSGGMAKSAGLVTRYYEPDDSKGPDPVNETTNAGPLSEAAAGKEICYVTAAQRTEEAAEVEIDDPTRRQGVFTYCLAKELKGVPRPWEAVMVAVRLEMRKKLERYVHYQNPLVTQGFLKQPVFHLAATAPSPNPSPNTLAWSPRDLLDVYESQERNPAQFKLKADPDEAQIPLGRSFKFSVESRSEGYLVILAESKGKLYRVYPTRTGSARDAKISATLDANGQPTAGIKPYSIPMACDEVKTEVFRAFLFRDEAEAQRLIGAVPEFSPASTVSPSDLTKEVLPVGNGMPVVLTSGVVIKPQLRYMGGLEVSDSDAFWQFLKGEDDLAQRARRKLASFPSIAEALADPAKRTPDRLCFAVNFCVGYANLFYNPDFDDETFDQKVARCAHLLAAGAKGLKVKEGAH